MYTTGTVFDGHLDVNEAFFQSQIPVNYLDLLNEKLVLPKDFSQVYTIP